MHMLYIARTPEGVTLTPQTEQEATTVNTLINTIAPGRITNGAVLKPGLPLSPALTTYALLGAAKFALPEALDSGEPVPASLHSDTLTTYDVRRMMCLADAGIRRLIDDPA